MNFWKSIFFTLLLLLPAATGAQDLMFYKYEVDLGLSHNTVRCILQDRDGFMWFGTADGLNRFDGKQYKIFPSENADTNDGELGNNSIYSLEQDDEGHIWIGTSRGVYIYDPYSETFQRFNTRTPEGSFINGIVRQIVFDEPNRMWFGTSGQGLFLYDTKADTLFQTRSYGSVISDISRASNGIMYIGTVNGKILEFDTNGHFLREIYPDLKNTEPGNVNITALYNDKNTIYCSVGASGLQAIDKKTEAVKVYRPDDKRFSISHYRKIFPLSEKELLIATDNGLLILNLISGRFQPYDTGNHFGISDQSVLDICRDSEGGLWIATEYGGVNYIPRNLRPFGHVIPVNATNMMGGRVISSFVEDDKDNIWIGTKDGGLIYYYPRRGMMSFYTPARRINGNSISYHNIRALLLDGNDLWIGTFSRGLDVMNTTTWEVRNYRHVSDSNTSINDNTVTALFKDREGTIYVGTTWGLNIYRPESDDFTQVSQLGNQASISDIIEDSRGNLWVATSNIGIYRMKRSDSTWTYFSYEHDNMMTIPNNRVTALFEDDKGIIWIGTEDGLCKYDYNSGEITRLDEDKKLFPSRMISAIEQDANGSLWVSTSGGIFCIDPQTDELLVQFTKTDGLQSNQFNAGASLATSDGRLYFGGINGFNYFNPQDLESNDYIPSVKITEVSINNQPLAPEKRTSATYTQTNEEEINPHKAIRLKHSDNNISIDFASLSYQSPQKNRYSYMLKGWDDEWIYTDNTTTAQYNNLPAGEYTFMVRGSNNDGIWSTETAALNFVIEKPFFLSLPAYIIYGIVIITAIVIGYYLVMQAQQHKLQEYAKEQERQSYHAQIDFFTNVAHEIRTPLTLIKVPLECIMNSGEGSPQLKNYLEMINTNTNNLLNLINQLLEFRKSGENQYALSLTRQEMKSFVTDICSKFNPAISVNNLTMELDMPDHELFFNIDTDAFTKIVNNLISNALKYAKNKITVSLRLKGTNLELSVSDDGKGVDIAERDKIFDTFYQPEGSKAGSGIGLHLAKLLTEKHGGTIKVSNNQQGGAIFTVSIPFIQPSDSKISDIIYDTPSPKGYSQMRGEETSDGKDRVLFVEDNGEVRKITGEFLETYYDVLYASNGQEAIDILDRENIDIIVTDLMMPEMDGYELTEFVKSDLRYSHIPVIQLTAKSSLEDKIKGLEYGSDAYIEKPFSLEHLNTQIVNLLENRRRLRKAYNTPPAARTENTGRAIYNKKDVEFIEKLNAEIDKFIQTEDISLDHLAESMFMSRSNFYRKIKGLFGVSPNEYVKRYRLKRAAAIIARNECRISDVYVKVGFNSASYFTKCFKKYFGVLPKDYASSLNANEIQDMDNIA